ncbi:MAG TPA: HEAT repeat domain-containing protein [Kofleriaceae bacterium]|nr:HEAT repeat domain-containing protein [Kofleriaceae bacterium]
MPITRVAGALCVCFVTASCLRAGFAVKEPTLSGPGQDIAAQIAAGDGPGAAAAFAQLDGDGAKVAADLAFVTLDRALASSSPAIRARAIDIVASHEIEPLADEVAGLLGDPDDDVAAAASVALLRSHPAAGRVASDLLDSASDSARAKVVAGIGRKVGARAHAELVVALSDPAARVRRAAAMALGGLGEAGDGAALWAVATGDPDGRVRSAALRAVARLPAADGDVRGALAALDDPYLGARQAAVSVLAARKALAELSAAARGADLHVAVAAALAVHRLGGASAAPVLSRALHSPLWTVRAAALASVKPGAGHREALSLAASAMVDDRVEVRLAAAKALASLGQVDRARAEFLAILEGPGSSLTREGDPSTSPSQRSAAAALVRLGDPHGAKFLASLAGARDPRVRGAAIAALSAADTVPPALIAALADPTAGIRLDAAASILTIAPLDF